LQTPKSLFNSKLLKIHDVKVTTTLKFYDTAQKIGLLALDDDRGKIMEEANLLA